MQLFDIEAFERLMTEAVEHYQTSAPTVSRYLDDLYIRVTTGEGEPVLLQEIIACQRIREEGQFMQANYAANFFYKLLDRLGRDTTGLIGF
jgi:hypothetical protein